MPSHPSHSSSRRFFAAFAFSQHTSLSSLSSLSSHPCRLSASNPRLARQRAQFPSPRCISTSPYRLKENITPQNHYSLFPHTLPAGPPPSGPFEVDLARLRKEFLQLQSRAHPDLHQGTSKTRAEGLSALINDAYKTLQHPLLRAQYILSLRGIEIADDESTQAENESGLALLMEVLEVREAIDEAETEKEVKALEAENAGRIGECVGRLEDFFARDDLQGARKEVGRLKYWSSIEEALKGWEKGKNVVWEH